jgi:hypothetical protein
VVVYEWDQTLEDLHLYFFPPEGVKAKMIQCDITPTTIKLGLKGNPPFINVSNLFEF